MISTAFVTPVADVQSSVTYASLAICPKTDKDIYKLTTTAANKNVEVLVTYDNGDPLIASVLNFGGTVIGAAVTNGPNSLRANVVQVPQGTYYVEITGSGSGENNYQETINVTP